MESDDRHCPICFDDYPQVNYEIHPRRPVRLSVCRHMYCRYCIVRYLTQRNNFGVYNNRCPHCHLELHHWTSGLDYTKAVQAISDLLIAATILLAVLWICKILLYYFLAYICLPYLWQLLKLTPAVIQFVYNMLLGTLKFLIGFVYVLLGLLVL